MSLMFTLHEHIFKKCVIADGVKFIIIIFIIFYLVVRRYLLIIFCGRSLQFNCSLSARDKAVTFQKIECFAFSLKH